MSVATVNTGIRFDLLHEQLDWIRADEARRNRNPQDWRWDQKSWLNITYKLNGEIDLCGSYACVAGHVALGAGAQLVWRIDGTVDDEVMWFNGEQWLIDDIATTVLGLTEREADDLFVSKNTLADLEQLVAEWESLS